MQTQFFLRARGEVAIFAAEKKPQFGVATHSVVTKVGGGLLPPRGGVVTKRGGSVTSARRGNKGGGVCYLAARRRGNKGWGVCYLPWCVVTKRVEGAFPRGFLAQKNQKTANAKGENPQTPNPKP